GEVVGSVEVGQAAEIGTAGVKVSVPSPREDEPPVAWRREGWPARNPAKAHRAATPVAGRRSMRWPRLGARRSSDGLLPCGCRSHAAAEDWPVHPRLRQLAQTNRSDGFRGW